MSLNASSLALHKSDSPHCVILLVLLHFKDTSETGVDLPVSWTIDDFNCILLYRDSFS